MRQRTVAGESIEVLRTALGKLKHRPTSDGMVHFTASLEPDLGKPLLRAVQRVEKELLAGDVAQGDRDARKGEPMLLSFSWNASV